LPTGNFRILGSPLAIEDAVDVVCTTPDIGEMKTGDLSGIRVYKFPFNRQEYLVTEKKIKRCDQNMILQQVFVVSTIKKCKPVF